MFGRQAVIDRQHAQPRRRADLGANVIMAVQPAHHKTAAVQIDHLRRSPRIVAVSYTHLDVYKRQVLFISTLSFLGLGVQPPLADWGGLVKENSAGLVYGIPAALAPAMAIAALAISVNLVADWVLSRTTSLKGGRGA